MKKNLLILAFLSFINVYPQYSFGILYFKDGSHEMGFITVKSNNKIKFKKETNLKPVTYDHTEVLGFNNNDEYEYVVIKQKPVILKVETKGKINLYSDIVAGAGHFNQNGVFYGSELRIIYYIQHEDTIIVNNGRLKKKDTFLIDDCPELLKKINHRKIKRRNLVEIIKFYNKNCD